MKYMSSLMVSIHVTEFQVIPFLGQGNASGDHTAPEFYLTPLITN